MVDDKPAPSTPQPADDKKDSVSKMEEVNFEEDDLFEEFGTALDAPTDQPEPLWVEEWDDEERDKEDFSQQLARELEQQQHAMQ